MLRFGRAVIFNNLLTREADPDHKSASGTLIASRTIVYIFWPFAVSSL